MTEITSVDELFSYWKPLGIQSNNLSYEFVHISVTDGSSSRLTMGSKFHKSTDCNILKLWKLRDMNIEDKFGRLGKNVLHTQKYIDNTQSAGERSGYTSSTVLSYYMRVK